MHSLLEITDIIEQHPCFNDEAHDRTGRIHLPVAPKCNIQCNFCEHRMCSDIQHPGWAARLLSVDEAISMVRSVVNERQSYDFVVGIAGPGDALANEQTFQTLALINELYPRIMGCLCTNGLLLEDKLEAITGAGVKAITVTVNAPDSAVAKNIYSWVKYRGTVYRGKEAAELLIDKQFNGIRKAVVAGLSVKVNTVLIPGINDRYMKKLAMHIKEAGADLMNIMPLIPSGKMKDYRNPTCDELIEARRTCEEIVPQFHRCEQCRADVVFLP
ncbi:MAG TPA: radical SAM protein [Dehalococcoidia bacterium]|nr:radical SAM protein [Dehalococcoidia bacterium]